MAIPILFFTDWYKFFVPLYVLYYSFMVMWFVNYYRRMKFAIPVIAAVPPETKIYAHPMETDMGETDKSVKENKEKSKTVFQEKERLLKERLQKYVDEKAYCEKDIPSGIVVDSFGVSQSFFRQYMKDHYGMISVRGARSFVCARQPVCLPKIPDIR